MTLQKAQSLSQAYLLLDPLRPLEGEWLERFYVERPETASIDPLLDELLLDNREDDKTLFTGHRGSGKTTELARLGAVMAETHTVVHLNVETLLNLGDVDYADLLVMMGLEVFRQAHATGVALEQKRVDALRFWYETHILEQDESLMMEGEVEGTLDIGIASIAARLRTDTPRRKKARAEAQANLSDLLERLNDLLDDLRQRTGKRILVIVDGLDKMFDLGQVRTLFLDGANALLEPRCRAIYTIPIALYYTNDFQQVRLSFHRNYSLPNVKVRERNGEPCSEGKDMLREVLERRMERDLLTPEAEELLVELSGGLLKELIALARSSVLRARRLQGNRGPVQVEDVEYAARQVRNTFHTSLTEEQYRALWHTIQGREFITNGPLVQELLHTLSLLEYNGDGTWWSVHPIVRPLVEEWAYAHGETATSNG